MAKAAERLAISQPVISKAIGDLERIVDVRLLDRSPRGVVPTAYGRALLKRAIAAFDDLRQGVRDIEAVADPTAGEIRVGSSEAMSAGFLPAIIERMSKKYPRINFRIEQTGIDDHEFPLLHERKVDVIVGRIPMPLKDDAVVAETLFYDRLQLGVGLKNPWYKRRRVTLAELVKEPWIRTSPEAWEGSLVGEAIRAQGLELPRLAVGSASPRLIDLLLDTGRFLGVMSSSALRYSGKRRGLKALPVELPVKPRPTGLITLKNYTVAPTVEIFIDYAREIAGVMHRD